MKETDRDLSRRAFCKGSACILGSAMLITLGPRLAKAEEQAKMAQKVALYQEKPKGDQQCDKCKVFVAPDSCQLVEGKISPTGWCQLFQKKA